MASTSSTTTTDHPRQRRHLIIENKCNCVCPTCPVCQPSTATTKATASGAKQTVKKQKQGRQRRTTSSSSSSSSRGIRSEQLPRAPTSMHSKERQQIKRVLENYIPATDFPAGLSQDAFYVMMPDFIVNAVNMMKDPQLRATFPNANKRYNYISQNMFRAYFYRSNTVRTAVYSLLSSMDDVLTGQKKSTH